MALIDRSTYLGTPNAPSFVVGVPAVPTGGTSKPMANSIMFGPYTEFMRNFWPMWDATNQKTIADIAGANPAQIQGNNLAWNLAEYGQGIGGNVTVGQDKLSITPIVLSGSYSLERLTRVAGTWLHEVIVNDTASDTNTTYYNAVSQGASDFMDSPLTISDLVGWNEADQAGQFEIEFARIWDVALESYQVSELFANPYVMFGMTQELLDEITTIVNFMKPMKTAWKFVNY